MIVWYSAFRVSKRWSKIVKGDFPLQGDLISKIIDKLKQVNLKIDSLIKINGDLLSTLKRINKKSEPSPSEETKVVPDVIAFLSLPSSLQKTMLAMYKLQEATATDLSKETERLTAVESACANQLTRMGYLKKRVGRKVYFYII